MGNVGQDFHLKNLFHFTTQQSMADSSTEAPFARVALLPLVVATVDCLASLPTSLKSVHEGHRIFVTLLERLRGQADWQQDPKLLELSASVPCPCPLQCLCLCDNRYISFSGTPR